MRELWLPVLQFSASDTVIKYFTFQLASFLEETEEQ
jgi:hypothetical protein